MDVPSSRSLIVSRHFPQAVDNPVFVVGSPRIASSFICSALIEAAGFCGSAEGHFLPLLNTLDEKVVGYYEMLNKQKLLNIAENTIARVPEYAIRHALLDVFRNYYSILFRGKRWVDKTVNVEMIMALPHC